ncbi:MAG TPA: IS200/IS605 family transposase [Terriglobales bacterium]|nr:IS200/IS605 family transposase [Terriglobales bacterium]
MGHSYSNVLVHIVFSTKNRAKIIPRDHQEDLWRYMTGIAKSVKANVLAIGGMPDHIHALVALPGTIGHSTLIQKIKENSSKWMGSKFEWQEGFGAFSVSDSRRDDVIAYIHNQEEHHKKRNFEEEFIALLKAHNVDYDPRYVFG